MSLFKSLKKLIITITLGRGRCVEDGCCPFKIVFDEDLYVVFDEELYVHYICFFALL